MPHSIEIIKAEHGWTVIAGDRFANSLGPDEALWVIATLLRGGDEVPRYMKNYEEEMAWRSRYCKTNDPPVPPVALLEDLRVRGPAVTVAKRMGIVRRTFDECGRVINRYVQLKGPA